MKEFCCTRPKLATLLIEAGYTADFGISPWNPKQHAWIFPMTPELARMVKDYYEAIDKPVPAAITEEVNRSTILQQLDRRNRSVTE